MHMMNNMTQKDLALEYRTSEKKFPSEYIEGLVPLLVKALDIIEGEKSYDANEIADLISKLSPYCRENLADKYRSDLLHLIRRNSEPSITSRLLRKPRQ